VKLGIIGRNWGSVYANTCRNLGIDYWIAGREWGEKADGYIIASPPETHYEIARDLLARGLPVIVEKPVTMDPGQAYELAGMGGIAFAGHTRLYDPRWKAFKQFVSRVTDVHCRAGGTKRDPWWDWGPHMVAMCLDLGFNPRRARFVVRKAREPLSFVVNGRYRFEDRPSSISPMACLLTEFVAAIRKGEPDSRLMPEVVEVLHELG
jgi:hypothetical protein